MGQHVNLLRQHANLDTQIQITNTRCSNGKNKVIKTRLAPQFQEGLQQMVEAWFRITKDQTSSLNSNRKAKKRRNLWQTSSMIVLNLKNCPELIRVRTKKEW